MAHGCRSCLLSSLRVAAGWRRSYAKLASSTCAQGKREVEADEDEDEDFPVSSGISRPLSEILKQINKKVPDTLVKSRHENGFTSKYIPWYHSKSFLFLCLFVFFCFCFKTSSPIQRLWCCISIAGTLLIELWTCMLQVLFLHSVSQWWFPILYFDNKFLHFVEWSGEVRSITYSADAKSVSVVYRVTLYGTDAEVCILSFIFFWCRWN